MMTKTEIEKLAREAVKGFRNFICPDGVGNPISEVELQVAVAIEQALATVPMVSAGEVQVVEEMLDFVAGGVSDADYDVFADVVTLIKKLPRSLPKKPYSVLAFWQNGDRNGYLNHVDACSPSEAAKATVDELIRSSPEEFKGATFEDFHIALICEGHINDIKED